MHKYIESKTNILAAWFHHSICVATGSFALPIRVLPQSEDPQ